MKLLMVFETNKEPTEEITLSRANLKSIELIMEMEGCTPVEWYTCSDETYEQMLAV